MYSRVIPPKVWKLKVSQSSQRNSLRTESLLFINFPSQNLWSGPRLTTHILSRKFKSSTEYRIIAVEGGARIHLWRGWSRSSAGWVVKSGLYRDTPSLYTCPRRPIVLLFPRLSSRPIRLPTVQLPPSGTSSPPPKSSFASPTSQLGPRRVYLAVTLSSLIPRYRGDSQPPSPPFSLPVTGVWSITIKDSSSRPNSGEGRFKLGLK